MLDLKPAAVVLAVVILSSGCTTDRGYVPPVGVAVLRVGLVQSGQLVSIKEGRLLEVTLPPAPQGRSWRHVRKPSARILAFVGAEPTRHTKGASSLAKGMVVYYDARGPGYTSLSLECGESRQALPEEKFELTVHVYY